MKTIKLLLSLFAIFGIVRSASGQIVGPIPNNLTNGTTIDAVPVMANYNWIMNQVNTNAAPIANPTFTGTVTGGAGGFVGALTGNVAGNISGTTGAFSSALSVHNAASLQLYNTGNSVVGSLNAAVLAATMLGEVPNPLAMVGAVEEMSRWPPLSFNPSD